MNEGKQNTTKKSSYEWKISIKKNRDKKLFVVILYEPNLLRVKTFYYHKLESR